MKVFPFLLFIFGIYYPTSINGVTSSLLFTISCAVLICVLLLLLVKQKKLSMLMIVCGLSINSIPLLFTLFSPFTEYAFGSSFYYLTLSLLFLVKLDIPYSFSSKALNIIHSLNITIGLMMISNVGFIDRFIIRFYSFFNNDLVVLMTDFNKPILTFTTHYIAATFFYLFFFICLETYKYKGGKTNLLFSMGYLVLLFYLDSNAAYFFFIAALLQIMYFFLRRKPSVLYSFIAILFLVALVKFETVMGFISHTMGRIYSIAISPTNGLLGRYTTNGILSRNFEYMSEHPFKPIGYGNSTDLFFGDSGIILNLIRGSAPLIIVLYGGLYLFLRYNIKSKFAMHIVFLSLILTESAFPILQYYRTICVLPFLIVYLNYIHERKAIVLNSKNASLDTLPFVQEMKGTA